ncbi:MAG: GntR family transcriptional regulator [Gammaproteobacteria bacterium]|nr:GntR family transcriptional regulator [Gammaproteobacteria bacterium]MBU1440363.1 GntR family transcriptional regulator [Gammaproteobacteria bacterium]MBU2407814.1 GntR family transcriptional regulator [Gammaproteobacteria bacterium]
MKKVRKEPTAPKPKKPAPARSRTPASAPESAPAGSQPRYLQIAGELKRAIADGSYPIGARLPTELELCEQFKISRFTAREAVRVLSVAGLVTRRPRVGTVVVALPDEARYMHDASSVNDLFQYAIDTQLRLVFIGKLALGKSLAKEFGVDAAGQEWIYAMGVRVTDSAVDDASRPPARAICITRIYLNPVLKGIETRLRERKSAVYALIEREYAMPIQRVEQELQGVVLDADDAANLGAQPGTPALRIIRRYFGENGQLLEVADNIHPSDRFSYRMHLRK